MKAVAASCHRSHPILHVVSVSGGKDSCATLLLALERCPIESIVPIFCDTGHEHPAVYDYLDYLERVLGVKIRRLKADFSEQIAAKRWFIARDQRTGRDSEGRRLRWSNKAKRRALGALHPTGNPFLDLCLWKGRFPSRKAQFCTEELKRDIAVGFQLELMEQGKRVISWQGIRRDESLRRFNAKKAERIGRGLYVFRPIVQWRATDVFSYCRAKGIEPNPLYLQGMGRVGCMPCVNCRKEELREISVRFPEHIDRVQQWEKIVGTCSKRGFSTLFTGSNKTKDRRIVFADLNIQTRIEWAKTTRGGQQYDLLFDDKETGCSSSYGLCESGA